MADARLRVDAVRSRRAAALAVAVVALGLLVAWNTAAVNRETRSAQRTLAGARILPLPGGDLQVAERGPRDAPPVVLLHCHTCSLRWWDPVVPALARRHRVIRLDLLGHGGSEKPRKGYSMRAQGRLLGQALTRLRARPAVLVGHSAAGAVATALAEQSPAAVRGIVTIATPPDGSRFGDVPFLARLASAPVVGQLLRRVTSDRVVASGYEHAFGRRFVDRRFPGRDRMVEDYRAMTHTAYRAPMRAFESYTGRIPVDARLARLGLPALAIFGSRDAEFDARRSLAAYRARGIATVMIPGAGHAPNVERPAAVARLLLRFARRVGRSRG